MCFLEFLARNALSFCGNNYIIALKYYFARYQWRNDVFDSLLVRRLLLGFQYSISSKPRLKGLFTLMQVRKILYLYESFNSLLTYRVAYLLAFYGLFRISNVATLSPKLFDKTRHLLHSDIVFVYPGVCIKVKWEKEHTSP